MDRRHFLAGLSAASLLALSGPARAQAPRKLLILVELKGGNDGLNTLVPFADPAYRRLRPRLAIGRDDALRLDDERGLHPSLESLMPAWSAGELALVQGLGYPDPNLSHFRSIEIWDTASRSDEYLDEGWLTRAFAKHPSPPGYAADGVVVGAADLGPLSGAGARTIALANPEQFLRNARLARSTAGTATNPSLAHILRVERDIQRSADRLHPGREFTTAFPAGPFGAAVRTAAQLAANREGISAIRLTLGGFDTHANQAGPHAALLRQLGEGLAALRGALKEIGRWPDTIVATYSEFGRRAQENQSGGTDHGTASVHFVIGGQVRGGLAGRAPALDQLDAGGNLVFTTDFRAYYGGLLEAAYGTPAGQEVGVAQPLRLLRA
ncbi:MAG: DUF1501 domain-containing protein [Betaproteobacteria bacterium]|nr:DUF1501 domain-containing protein [Betaproteobacteria bacterium]